MEVMALAKIFGPLLVLVVLGMMINMGKANEMLNEYSKSRLGNFIVSIIRALVGLYVINVYSVWDWTPAVSITLFGWIMVVGGIYGLLLPDNMMMIKKGFTKNHMLFGLLLLVMLVIGLMMTSVGYMS